jgi:hypothetical protein
MECRAVATTNKDESASRSCSTGVFSWSFSPASKRGQPPCEAIRPARQSRRDAVLMGGCPQQRVIYHHGLSGPDPASWVV